MINEALISQVKNLSVLDRIALIDQVWQSLGDEEIPVTNKQKALLDDRLADLDANPDQQSSWTELKQYSKIECFGAS